MTQTAAKRIDPSPRPYDGTNAFGLKNQDPTRHYVQVYMKDEAALEKYIAAGYVPSTYGDGGAQPFFKSGEKGSNIELGGHLLMSVSKERKAEIDEVGHFGDSGWRLTRALEEKIVDKVNGNPDVTRGIQPKYFGFQNNTTPLERDRD